MAAVEFANLALSLVLFAIAEVAAVLLASMQFEQATDRVSRQIRTGDSIGAKIAIRFRKA